MTEKKTERVRIKPERLLAFSDGVLAIIMTLMILEIKAAVCRPRCHFPAGVRRFPQDAPPPARPTC
jgi:hypothetical protein